MATQLLREIRQNVKRLAHTTGGLPVYHRVRNHQWLTVFCLHRVLPPTDPRYVEADKEWTLTVDQLADVLSFVKQHFNPVSLDEVLEARLHGGILPPRPLLLTFDDGWADNEEHALPVLEAAKMPGVIFVTSDAIGKSAPFWFEVLRMAHSGGRIDGETWAGLWAAIGRPAPTERNKRELEELLRFLWELTQARREELLAPWRGRLEDGWRHMVTPDQIRRLHARGVAIGAHGRTHQPLSLCENLEDELAEPRRRLEAIVGKRVTTLAFPHSRFTSEALRAAKRAGYELVFTGTPELTPTRAIPFAVGRVGITFGSYDDGQGRFAQDRLAAHVFRRPHLAPKRPQRPDKYVPFTI